MLRARAYGPGADIHADAAALGRLRELEALERRATSTQGEPVDAAAPATAPAVEPATAGPQPGQQADAAPQPPVPKATAPDDDTASTPDTAPTPSRWSLPVLWALSLVTAIIAAVLGSAAVIQRDTPDPHGLGATQVIRLGEESGVDIPAYFTFGGTSSPRVFSEFRGMRAVVVPDGIVTDGYVDECLFITTAAGFDLATSSVQGLVLTGCAANAFPAAIAIKVTEQMPDELRSDYPIGTALQFVFDEPSGEIVIYSSAE